VKRRTLSAIFWPFVLLGLLLTGCANSAASTVPWDRPSAPTGISLSDLHNVSELQARFNQDVGKTRLVLLVSPT
jgi:hypothetical protein